MILAKMSIVASPLEPCAYCTVSTPPTQAACFKQLPGSLNCIAMSYGHLDDTTQAVWTLFFSDFFFYFTLERMTPVGVDYVEFFP